MAKGTSEPLSADKYQQLLDQLSAAGGLGGEYFFPKVGKTKIRMVCEKGQEYNFFREVINNYGRKKYMFLGVILESEAKGRDGQDLADPNKVRGIVISKTPLKQIIANLAEGFDFFDPVNGHAIAILREGTGKNDTNYSVTSSPRPVPVADDIEWPEGGLDELAEKYSQSNLDRVGASQTDESGEPPW